MVYQRPKTIVVIDDDSMMSAIVSGYLKTDGYDVYAYNHPDSGLQGVVAHKPAVIILDRHLGQLDGTDVLVKIRAYKDSADTPVLMLTGDARKEEVVKAIKLGASDYLAKPFMPQELLSKVQKLLDSSKKE